MAAAREGRWSIITAVSPPRGRRCSASEHPRQSVASCVLGVSATSFIVTQLARPGRAHSDHVFFVCSQTSVSLTHPSAAAGGLPLYFRTLIMPTVYHGSPCGGNMERGPKKNKMPKCHISKIEPLASRYHREGEELPLRASSSSLFGYRAGLACPPNQSTGGTAGVPQGYRWHIYRRNML